MAKIVSNENLLTPQKNERPTDFADRLGSFHIGKQQKDRTKKYGQYLTPPTVAKFMASLFDQSVPGPEVSILEPGAGTGILSAAICERLAEMKNKPQRINLAVYELDSKVIPYLEKSLAYLKSWLNKKDVKLVYSIISDDFILKNANALDDDPQLPFGHNKPVLYDLIIANPPYFKLSKSDPRAKVAETVVHGQPNIYALFMAVSAKLLKPQREMVFITPRSYTAGPYFRLFREKFFSWVKPIAIHLFESRKDAFNRDKVLQENVILKAKRLDTKTSRLHSVQVSFSNGLADLAKPEKTSMPVSELLDMGSKDKMLHIPLRHSDRTIMTLVRSWKFTLHSHGMEASTGPIVSFRARNFLDADGNLSRNHAPLFLIHNITALGVQWPMQKANKPQFFKISQEAESLLVPNKNYVFLRRFSAKEEVRRLVAAPYNSLQISSHHLGLENHLNYIYKPHGQLLPEEAYGLAALFNSEILDNYFRTFNGNTQVNASELRHMPLPDLETIRYIGQKIMTKPKIQTQELDSLIKTILINH